VQAELAQRLAVNFATTPNVFVSIERLAEVKAPTGGIAAPREEPTISVYVIGEGAKSGKISVPPGTTVLQFFAEMGGFSKFAATKRIQLRRTDKKTGEDKTYGLNYQDMVNGGSKQGNTVLADGDIIIIPQRRLFE
jgi:polysaccharide biosynthesis/export protein